MNRLTLCQGGQEALCSGVMRAARRGSWQWQGTMSMGYPVPSCPQRQRGEIQKGQKALRMFVRNWGNRGEGSVELLGMHRGVPEPRAHSPLPGL